MLINDNRRSTLCKLERFQCQHTGVPIAGAVSLKMYAFAGNLIGNYSGGVRFVGAQNTAFTYIQNARQVRVTHCAKLRAYVAYLHPAQQRQPEAY